MPQSFRERVDVTSIIRSILDSYPLGSGILRELLQNSDDAKATKQIFILDLRTHPSESLLDPDLVHCQGPSLLAVNDSLFTQSDWDAIRTIHNSSKTDDETQTGKFGIGVRACYHVGFVLQITDNPHFLSGRKLVVFDPHERFSEDREGGIQIDFVAEGTSYRDQLCAFDQFVDSTDVQPYTGTVDLSVVMLFLKHIRYICLKVINPNGVETFIGSAEIPDLSIAEKRTLSRTADAREETFKCTINIQASNAPPVSRLWRILHTVQSDKDTLAILDGHLGYAVSRKLLTKDKLFSHVALAFPINHDGNFDGRLFTVLPLPILTGFPAHLHAILALTQDRQSLRNIEEMGTDKSRERLLVTWNRSIFDTFLPATWGKLLRILIEEGEVQDIWSAWPNSDHANDYWKKILPNLMDQVIDSDLPVFPTFPDAKTHVSLLSALVASPDDDTAVLMVLSRIGLLIVQPPQPIQNVLDSSSVTFLHPNTVQNALLSRISALAEAAEEDKDRILEYLVLKPGTISNATGLPLIPLVNGSRVLLSESSGQTHILVTEQEEKVFGDCDEKLISLSRMSAGVSKALLSSSIPRLDPTKVQSYLESKFGRFDPACGGIQKKIGWLTRFWKWMVHWPGAKDLLPLIEQLHLLPTVQGPLCKMCSRIALPIGGRPGNRLETTQAWTAIGVDFLHPKVLPYQTAFRDYTVPADDIAFLVDAIRPHLIPHLDANSVRLIQNHVVQVVSTLDGSGKRDLASRSAFITKFSQLPIFPIRVVVHDEAHENQWSEISLSDACGPLVFVRVSDHFPVPLLSDQKMFDIGHSSGILGTLLDPTGYNKPLDEVGVLEMAIGHLQFQPRENFEALLARIIRRLPDLSSAAKVQLHSLPFVPVRDSSEKIPPNQVIDPGSELLELYRGEPGKLPDLLWGEEYLPLLRPHGFFLQKLTPEIVTERITYLSGSWTEADFPATFIKAQWFAMLLNKHWGLIGQDINISDRLTAKWLPIKDCARLAAPCESRDNLKSNSYLFDLVLTVVDVKIYNPTLREALGWADIPVRVLRSQFRKALIDHFHRAARLYILIKEFSRRLRQLSADDITDLRSAVSDHPSWIPESRSGPKIVETKYALLRPSTLSGPGSRFHTIPEDLLDSQGRLFLHQMGCSDSPCLETLLSELELLAAETSKQPHEVVLHVLAILRGISAILPERTHRDYSRILVPGEDSTSILRPIAHVYFKDTAAGFSPGPGYFRTHSAVSMSLAQALHVEALSSMALGNDDDDFDDLQMGEDFTKRVESVLKDYDVEYALNEYLANAADAKATEFSIVLDERTFECSKVIGPKLADLQRRPSLFLYNNGVFTRDDFRGLRTVGQGGKGSDPDSIGRYGLGALSLFHFTDVVQLISGDYLLILDPSGDHLPALKGNVPRTSFMMTLSKVYSRYPDQLACFDSLHGFSKSDPHYKGTLFRLPLRTESSRISPTSCSISRCNYLLNGTYFALAKDAMYFTRLDHISANQRPPVGSLTSLWSVSASRRTQAEDHELVSLTINGQNSTVSSQEWLVTKSITSPSDAPMKYGPVLAEMKLHQSKVGLVVRMAFRLKDTETGSSENPTRYSLFSSLRLPVQTFLCAHIHAQFALSSDRRHIRFEPPDGSGGRIPQAAYNEWILSELIPPLYISSIPHLSKSLPDKDPFGWWPTLPAGSDEISRTVVRAFYDRVPTSPSPICLSVTSNRIAPIDAIFCRSDTPAEVIKVLHVLQCSNLVDLPRRREIYILTSASKAASSFPNVDPAFVRNFLQFRGAVLPYLFTNKILTPGDVSGMLVFLLKGAMSISGLPLLVQADNSLVCATAEGPVKYVTQGRPKSIFPQDRFLQLSAEARDLVLQHADVNVKLFDETAVVALLKEQIPTQSRCTHSSETVQWIENFWHNYKDLPGPPKISLFDTVPVIPTKNGDHISATYCGRDDAMCEPGIADALADVQPVAVMQRMGIIFYCLPAPLASEGSCIKPFSFHTCLRAVQSKTSAFSHLSPDETRYVCEWIRSRIYYSTDADKNIVLALPIWEALQGNQRVLLPAPQIEMLPFHSLHLATFVHYLRPAIALAEYSVPLQTVIRWSPVRQAMSSTRLAEILSLPDNLPATDLDAYSRLLQAFLSLQDGEAWQLPVPDGDLVLRPGFSPPASLQGIDVQG
ncbi:hypothetical protein FB451DRAFT_1371271 [Mycena latifolia]|nr:hypothetical protein FB451DRAFT_1371271 [Mycena latifolia]